MGRFVFLGRAILIAAILGFLAGLLLDFWLSESRGVPFEFAWGRPIVVSGLLVVIQVIQLISSKGQQINRDKHD
jgi:hypothetical protein